MSHVGKAGVGMQALPMSDKGHYHTQAELMTMVDWGAVLTSLVSAALIAAGGLLFVRSTAFGRSWWDALGTGKGGRATAAIAVAALLLALSSLVWLAISPRRITMTAERIGPKGIEGTVADPGYFENTNSFQAIAESTNSDFCAISNILITSNITPFPSTGGGCELHYAPKGTPWRINVVGTAKCRATCYKIGFSY